MTKVCPKAPGCVLITNVTKATSFIIISGAPHHSTPRCHIQAATQTVSEVKHSGARGDKTITSWKFNLMYLGHQKSYHLLHHLLDEIVDLGMVLPLRGNKAQQLKVQHITLYTHYSRVKTATVPKLGTQVILRQHSSGKVNEGSTGQRDGGQAGMKKDNDKGWMTKQQTTPPTIAAGVAKTFVWTVPFHRI